MKNIKSFYMKNFQSHKDTNIVLSPNITTFVGESGMGKSALFRLLKLVIKNEPRGVEYISGGETKMIGGVVFEDDVEVVRERSKAINRYTIHHPDGTSLQFEKFKTDIPPPVLEALEYQPIKIDTDLSIDLNFAEQLEAPFLLGDSDASKAKTIDGLARINLFNIALRNTNKDISNFNNESKSFQRQVEEIDRQLEQYEDLPQVEENLTKIEAIISTLEELQNKKEMYERFVSQQNEISQRMSDTEDVIERLKPITTIEEDLRRMSLLIHQKQGYAALFNSYKRVGQEIEEMSAVLSHRENILQAEEQIHRLNRLMGEKRLYVDLDTRYTELTTNISKGEDYILRMRPIREAEQLLSGLGERIVQKGKLVDAHQQYEKNISNQKLWADLIQRLEGVKHVETLMQDLNGMLQRRQTLNELGTSLQTCQESIQKGLVYRQHVSQEIETNKQQYAQALKQFNKCPVCFGELNDEHIHQVVESL